MKETRRLERKKGRTSSKVQVKKQKNYLIGKKKLIKKSLYRGKIKRKRRIDFSETSLIQ